MRLGPLTLRSALLPVAVLAATGDYSCQVNTDSSTGELRINGTVHFLAVEGGCWQLRTDGGRRYELRPDQAPDDILQDGARVSLFGAIRDDLASVCQVGALLDVLRVTWVDPS
ncbi:MAG: hypothetical protein ACREMX_03800 [Gemmatimonadales bacterium]